MSNSTKITDYLGIGLASARPASAPVAAGCMALYYATDSTALSGWNGSAWVTLTTGAASAWSAGSVTALATGLTITSDTLTPNYQAGSLTAFNTGLTLNSGTLTPNYQAGSLTAVGAGLTLTSGTLTAEGGGGGAVTTVVAGANLTGGTITGSGTVAVQSSPTFTTSGTALPAVVDQGTGTISDTLPGGDVFELRGADTHPSRFFNRAYGSFPTNVGVRYDGTRASPTAIVSGDDLFALTAEGFNGTSAVAAAQIMFNATENWGGTNNGADIVFLTTTNGSTSLTARGTVNAGGTLDFGFMQVDTALAVAGTLSSFPIGAGLSLSAGSIVSNYQAGSLTTIGTGLTLTSGTLSSTGAITAAAFGATINSGTVEIDQNVTLTGTNGSTTTIAPGSGTSWVVLNMPTTAGTVTLAAAPTFKGQRAILDIVFGATISTPSPNSNFKFTGGVSSYTPGTVASTIDRFEIFSPDNTNWVVLALSQGGTL